MEVTTEMKDQFISFCEEKYGKDKTRKATMLGTAVAVASFVIATMCHIWHWLRTNLVPQIQKKPQMIF